MKQQSIKTNYFLNTAYQVLTLITPLITAPYLSRVFGPSGVGVYSYTNSIATFFAMFATLGTSTYGQRLIAQSRDDKMSRSTVFWEVECLALATTLICTVCWLLFSTIVRANNLYFYLLTFQIIGAGLNITWFYAGLERFSLIVLRNVVVKVATIAALFLFVKTIDDLSIYIGLMAVSVFVGNLSMWMPLKRYVVLVPLNSLRIRRHLRETMVYFIPTIASSVYTYLDKTMIGIFTEGSAENGYYEQAHRIIIMAYTVVISLNTVMASRISYLFGQGKTEEIKAKLEQALAFILTISLPLAFGIAGIADDFVPWFFGTGFEKVALLLKCSCPLVVILSLHNFLAAQYLVPCGYRARSTKGVLAGAVINFCCNLLLIPRFQAIGAVVASLIAEASICVIYSYMSKEYVPYRMYLKYLPDRLISCVAMFVVVTNLGSITSLDGFILTIAQILLGSIVYFGILILRRDNVTINFLRSLIN